MLSGQYAGSSRLQLRLVKVLLYYMATQFKENLCTLKMKFIRNIFVVYVGSFVCARVHARASIGNLISDKTSSDICISQ